METNHINYDIEKSAKRIDDILNASNTEFEELKEIPSRDKLTFTNGFYIKVGALFVDIRDSSDLTDEHKRPTLAKLYRSYISEVVAIINSYEDCKEINIVGDCVSAIFNARYQSQLQAMFSCSAKINSLIEILNYKLKKKNIQTISIGIGLAYGRTLMVKAGYAGSSINDVVWMGDVVNEASNLCNKANKGYNKCILIDGEVQCNLTEHQKSLLKYNYAEQCYEGDIIDCTMEEWYKENCKLMD